MTKKGPDRAVVFGRQKTGGDGIESGGRQSDGLKEMLGTVLAIKEGEHVAIGTQGSPLPRPLKIVMFGQVNTPLSSWTQQLTNSQ